MSMMQWSGFLLLINYNDKADDSSKTINFTGHTCLFLGTCFIAEEQRFSKTLQLCNLSDCGQVYITPTTT